MQQDVRGLSRTATVMVEDKQSQVSEGRKYAKIQNT